MSLNFDMAAIRAAAQRGLNDAAEVVKQESIQRTPEGNRRAAQRLLHGVR